MPASLVKRCEMPIRYCGTVHSSVTTKQPQPHRMRDWYPYYAGFPNDFVGAAIDAHFGTAESMLDPWNGSGTTTAVAAVKGIPARGIEINPAATIVARARLTPIPIRDSLVPIAEEIVLAANRLIHTDRETEPLARWLRRPAVTRLRSLQRSVHEVLVSDSSLEPVLAHDPERGSNELGLLPSFYYTALFATTRDLLLPFKGTNPTWLKYPDSYRHRINPTSDHIVALFLERVEYLADRLMVPDKPAAAATSLRTGSVLDLGDVDAFDSCLTSPPYATRVDYVRNSLAELAVLGLSDDSIQNLRKRTTGTPLVKGVESAEVTLSSELAERVVDRVRSHPSHGSESYYGPWMRNYLCDLQRSLELIDRSVTSGGAIGLVVQDSHYKDIHIDLQRIVTQTMESLGRCVRSEAHFVVKHSLARMNPTARKHLASGPTRESLIVFGSGS